MSSMFNTDIRNGLTVTKLVISHTGTYNQQYRRPYQTNVDGSTVDIFNERIHSTNHITPETVAGIASHFVKPMATPEASVSIENGWGTKRMRYMMEIETYFPGIGSKLVEMVQGFTEHSEGVTFSGAIDPKLTFYINSIASKRTTIENTPYGRQDYVTIADNSHLIVSNDWGGMYQSAPEYRMRPEDVYSMMTLNGMPGTSNLIDQRTVHSNLAVKSSRLNSVPANYMAGILNNWRSASSNEGLGLSNLETIEKARNYSSEKSAAKDPFIQAIAKIRNQPPGDTFTYGDLCRLDPNTDALAQIIWPGPTEQFHEAGSTAAWGASDGYTQAAVVLSQAIPGLLMKQGLTRIVLRSTNHDNGGKVTTIVYDQDGFSTAARLKEAVMNFVTDFEFQLIQDMTYQGMISYMVEVQADLVGETWIRLSLNGEPSIDYVTPSFSDALIIPVITKQNQLAQNVASDFNQLMDSVVRSPCVEGTQFANGFGIV